MHPNHGRVVSNLIVQALKGEDITLYGDGQQTRSFCNVDDLIEAMMRMMATSPEVTGPINIGNPGEFTIRELAEAVLDLTGSKSKLVHRPLPPDDPRQRRPDITKAKAVLGWEPKIRLREGPTRTILIFGRPRCIIDFFLAMKRSIFYLLVRKSRVFCTIILTVKANGGY